MAFNPGMIVTAGRLNLLQPAVYYAVASSALVGPQTNADVPGATLTFDTVNDNAQYTAETVFDYDLTGSTTSLGSGNIHVDGNIQPVYAVSQANVANDRASVAQNYEGTLPTAGTHTIKLVASPVTDQQVNIYTSLKVTIYENIV